MFRIFKLILLITHFLLSLSSHLQIKEIQESWFKAVEQCNTTSSRIATLHDIYGVDKDTHICKGYGIKPITSYWIGSYHKLSNTISVEGCYKIDLIDRERNHLGNGHSSLRYCYLECNKISNATITFAYKNDTAGGPNCFCNLNAIQQLTNISERNLSKCTRFDRPLWWRYKILKNEFPTKNESCHMISCEDSISKEKFVNDILCGHYNGKTPDEDSRYVCTSTDNNMPPSQLLPRRFSFISNASIKTDSYPTNHMIAECKSITCLTDNTFKITIKNCTSETLRFLCLNGSKTIPFYGSKKPKNNSSHTTATKLSTKSSFEAKKPNAPSVSKSIKDASTSVDTTLYVQITTKLSSTYISSVAISHVTNPGKDNMFQSTSPIVLNQNVDSTSSICLILGSIFGTVVIIVAGVVLVSCRFRRRGPFKNKGYGDDSQRAELHGRKNHAIDIVSNKEPHIVNNTTYEMQVVTENVNELSILAHDSNKIPNSEYAVVIKKTKMNGNTTNIQSHGEENLDEIENDYDGLNHNRPDSSNKRINNNNIYDTALGFHDKSDPTYVTTIQVQIVEKDENCVYDHV